MKTAVGVYDTHDEAVVAVRKLKEANFPVKHLSILGRAETEAVDEDARIAPKNPLNLTGLGVGTTVGAALGVLTGAGVFLIPGLGFLYGAGALVGAIAGLDLGLIGGGLASVLTNLGVDDEEEKYHKQLEEGKFLLIAEGEQEEINRAKRLLQS